MHETQDFIRKIIYWLKKHLGPENENSSFYILIGSMLLIFWMGINVFLELAEGLQENELLPFDEQFQEWVMSFHHPTLSAVTVIITNLGDVLATSIIIILLGIYLAKRKRWWLVAQITFVTVLSSMATLVLKNTYQRERPTIGHLVEIGGLSFPSGHSLSAMAFYGFLIYILFRFVWQKPLKYFLIFLCLMLIFGIGFSRIYLGVHYPSDVLAGYMAGMIWMSFCIMLFNVIDLWRKRVNRRNNRE